MEALEEPEGPSADRLGMMEEVAGVVRQPAGLVGVGGEEAGGAGGSLGNGMGHGRSCG